MNVAGFLQLITWKKLPSFVLIIAEFRNGNFLIQQFVENEKFIHLTYYLVGMGGGQEIS